MKKIQFQWMIYWEHLIEWMRYLQSNGNLNIHSIIFIFFFHTKTLHIYKIHIYYKFIYIYPNNCLFTETKLPEKFSTQQFKWNCAYRHAHMRQQYTHLNTRACNTGRSVICSNFVDPELRTPCFTPYVLIMKINDSCSTKRKGRRAQQQQQQQHLWTKCAQQ